MLACSASLLLLLLLLLKTLTLLLLIALRHALTHSLALPLSAMLAARKRSLPLLAALTLILVVVFYHRDRADRLYQKWSDSLEAHPSKLPANSTLGFGAVVVVSKEGSHRRHALLQAANVTDVDLTIPPQPQWTEGDIQQFTNGQDDVQKGSILAWLGHHNALRWQVPPRLPPHTNPR